MLYRAVFPVMFLIIAGLLTACGETEEEKQRNKALKILAEAEKLYTEEDYYTAIQYYQHAADLNNAEAQYKLAYCYENGLGTKKDVYTARNIYQNAADNGFNDAIFKVACCSKLLNEKDYAETYFTKAAELGQVEAVYELALLSLEKRDLDIAISHLIAAAEKNHSRAMYDLAEIILAGDYEVMDFTDAVNYLIKAAENNYPPALYLLSNYYETGNLVEYSPGKAIDYLEQSAGLGYEPAEIKYAQYLENNFNYTAAYNFYLSAANKGNAVAQYKVAYYLQNGRNGTSSPHEAEKWYKKSAEQDYIPAMFEYGVMLEKKELLQDAIFWFEKTEQTARKLAEAKEDISIYRKTLGNVLYKLGLYHADDDFETSWEYYKKAAEYDHMEAQFILGVNYYFGHLPEVAVDRGKAEEWFQKAIDNGHSFALLMKLEANPNKDVIMKYILAVSGDNNAKYAYAQELLSGTNIPKDEKTAVRFLAEAVEAGHLDSVYQYAICQLEGVGMEPDSELALFYLTQAASLKHTKSIYLLAQWKYSGLVGGKNIEEALKLFEEAALLGHVEAPIMLGDHYKDKADAAAKDAAYAYDARGVEAEAEKLEFITKARYWYKMAAQSDNPIAASRLASLFPDFRMAKLYYQPRAEDGEPEAQAELAKLYFSGTALPVITNADNFCNFVYYAEEGNNSNETEGQYWLNKSLASKCTEAEFVMGLCNYFGWSITQNDNNARTWFEKAAKKNHIDAQFVMGIMLCKGIGGSKNEEKGREWFCTAAQLGHMEAQRCLALCYEKGIGGPKEYAACKFWYKTLANQGDPQAQNWLLQDASQPMLETIEDLTAYGRSFGIEVDDYYNLVRFDSQTGGKVCNIPEGVKSVDPQAFGYNSVLTHVTIPETVTSLDPVTFGECSALKSIRLPRHLTVTEFPFGCKIVSY